MSKTILCLVLMAMQIIVAVNSQIIWNGNWALGCDFRGKTIENRRSNQYKSKTKQIVFKNFKSGTLDPKNRLKMRFLEFLGLKFLKFQKQL